ncbi:MAG: hypothetical protein NTW29_23035 [Bacteroidetes bacterium]|nr:hypothetical protein [Bacteroidota bacterium]
MNDRLKNYIDEHRALFDDEQPGEQVWQHVQHQLPGEVIVRRIKKRYVNWWAAAAILILLAGTAYLLTNRKQLPVPPVVEKGNDRMDEPIELTDPVFAKQFTQYREMIGLQRAELKQLEKEYPQLYHQFVNDMNELDSSYQSLKKKLPAIPNRELLLEAMLQNLQLQSELLNRQLIIIKEIKQKNKQYEKDKT